MPKIVTPRADEMTVPEAVRTLGVDRVTVWRWRTSAKERTLQTGHASRVHCAREPFIWGSTR